MEVTRAVNKTIEKYISIFPVVGILGPRQIGKTTLAKSLAGDKEVIYLDLESERDRLKLSDPVIYLENHSDKLVILDEIQFMPELFNELRGIIDRNRKPGRFLILGSASPSIIKKSADSLAGRVGYVELSSINLAEVASKEENNLWNRGGFPLSFLASSDENSLIWRQNFIRTYIERDLNLLGLGSEPQTTERFWRMLANVHGQLWNSEDIGRAMGLTRTTVNRYLEVMEGAFLVRRLLPYYVNIPKRLIKSPKIYLRDSGILHAFNGSENLTELIENPIIGASWEGFVIEQIISTIGDRTNAFFYRTHQGAECDLILEKGGKVIAAIEIKHSSAPTISKGFRISMADTQAEKGFIIAKVKESYSADNGQVQIMSLLQFLESIVPEL